MMPDFGDGRPAPRIPLAKVLAGGLGVAGMTRGPGAVVMGHDGLAG